MITKGTTHNNGVRLARYITTGKPGERAELWQLRGFEATNIKDAFRNVHIMAKAGKCQQPFFHVQVRNRDGEHLTRDQWEHAADRIERMLGLGGQPRAIAFHTFDNGDSHMHLVWSRIREDDLTAIPLPFFKLRLKKLSRELELEFALEPVTSRRPDEIRFAPTRAEQEQARRLGIDVHEVRNTIRSCYERSDCGAGLQAALEHEGLILARGEKRDFIVVDHCGGIYALGKRILDVSAAKIRDRLSDLDRENLPSVEMARTALAGHELETPEKRERAAQMWDRDRADGEWMDSVIRASIAKEKTERRFEASDGKARELVERLRPKPETKREETGLFDLVFPGRTNQAGLKPEPRSHRRARAGKGATRAVGKTLDAIGTAFESLFAPVASPEQRCEGEITQRRRELEAEKANDLARYAEQATRQREEAERRQNRDRDGGGRDR
jgi:hypothetical protein